MLPLITAALSFPMYWCWGAHTLIMKTLLIWAPFFAVASWSVWKFCCDYLRMYGMCGNAVGYRMCRKGLAVLPILWAAGILSVILLVRQWAAVFLAAVVSMIAAVLYLAFADVYDFYSAGAAKKSHLAYRPHR